MFKNSFFFFVDFLKLRYTSGIEELYERLTSIIKSKDLVDELFARLVDFYNLKEADYQQNKVKVLDILNKYIQTKN